MSRSQRIKGKVGEREFAKLLIEYGFDARRDGRLDDDLSHDVPGAHIEVKRRERLDIPAWLKQTEADAKGRDPILAFRTNGQPWRCVVDAKFLLALLAYVHRDRVS